MQIVIFFSTRSAAASGKSLVLRRDGSRLASHARDFLCVEWKYPLVSYPILYPWSCIKNSYDIIVMGKLVAKIYK